MYLYFIYYQLLQHVCACKFNEFFFFFFLQEAWAICRIFKKANSSTQRALSHSWISPSFDQTTTTTSDRAINPLNNFHNFNSSNTPLLQSSIASFSPMHFPEVYQMENGGKPHYKINPEANPINDASSLLLEMSTSIFGVEKSDFNALINEHCNGFSAAAANMQQNVLQVKDDHNVVDDHEWGVIRSYPMSLTEAWKWDSSSPCPSELSTCYSTNNCYT